MGGQWSSDIKLSEELEKRVMNIFKKIDTDNSGTIDKQETLKYWKGNFAKISTDQLFKEVDKDQNGDISIEEWLQFWKNIKEKGNTEEEIFEEIEMLEQGMSWAHFE